MEHRGGRRERWRAPAPGEAASLAAQMSNGNPRRRGTREWVGKDIWINAALLFSKSDKKKKIAPQINTLTQFTKKSTKKTTFSHIKVMLLKTQVNRIYKKQTEIFLIGSYWGEGMTSLKYWKKTENHVSLKFYTRGRYNIKRKIEQIFSDKIRQDNTS
jgi:hypothetical protein